jgi:ketosteroid isomerase-like protein
MGIFLQSLGFVLAHDGGKMNLNNEKIIRDYFRAIEKGVPKQELENYLHPQIYQYEFPSKLNPKGKGRNLQELLNDFEKGKTLISEQTYKIKSMVSGGDQVCVETEWIGKLAIKIGSLNAGDQMRANFGVFFEIKDERIIKQNNYDCIHPW